ncbi:MAG: class I SAM-dependent methyltransferase [Pyrinomonadaceae bacterium]
MKDAKYIPALSYDWLTPFYDRVVRLTTREKFFKRSLVKQANVDAEHRVLDLACGTGTLTVLIKTMQPKADVLGIDGDPKILRIAKRKAQTSNLEIEFNEGMSFELPYLDQSFDRVFSSLFFHHLTRENKFRTIYEVARVLKSNGELHVADWGRPYNGLMRFLSNGIKLIDGVETTTDNFDGLLPSFLSECGFRRIMETSHFNTWFGTIRLLKAIK